MAFDIPFHSVTLFYLQLPRHIKEILGGGARWVFEVQYNTPFSIPCNFHPSRCFFIFFKSNVFYFLKENVFFSFLSHCLQFISQNANVPSLCCTPAPKKCHRNCKVIQCLVTALQYLPKYPCRSIHE